MLRCSGRRSACAPSASTPCAGRAGAPEAAAAEQAPWHRPFFALAVRLIGVTFVLWYSAWFLHALVLQWHPALHMSRTTETDWESFISAAVVLALGIYLISGAKRLVNAVFRGETVAATE